MTIKKKRLPANWLWAIIFFLLGILIYNGTPGFSFSAYICFGIGGLFIIYRLLHLLSRRYLKAASACRRILTFCLCIGIIAAAITSIIIYKGSLGGPQTSCSHIIVLGAKVNGTAPSLSLHERINGAYEYLSTHPETVCVVSGGQGNGELISEAQCMYNELTRMGISQERIWLEAESTSTRENLQFSLALIYDRTGSYPTEIGLVSSEYHLYRAGLLAKDFNVTAVGIPATTQWLSLRINYFLREIAAVWAYYVFGG